MEDYLKTIREHDEEGRADIQQAMTEKEYMEARALGTVTAAINTLKDLPHDTMDGILEKPEYGAVMASLYRWQLRLFESIETEE